MEIVSHALNIAYNSAGGGKPLLFTIFARPQWPTFSLLLKIHHLNTDS
jgi:hypothetical protein